MSFRLKICIWIISSMLCRFGAFAQAIHFTAVDPPKESPWSGVFGLAQDPQGYLWIASDIGLDKYDGRKYISYRNDSKNPNSISPGKMEKVYADSRGIIWIANYVTGLDRLDPATSIFTHYRHQSGNAGSLVNDTIRAIIEDRQGTMWFGTNGGLDKFDPKTGTFKHFVHRANDPASLSNNQVRVLYLDRQGTMWVGTGGTWAGETPKGEGGLNKLDKKTGKFTRYLHDANDPGSLTDNRVGAIFEDSRGIFWVGTAGDGLHTMNREKGTFQRHPYDPTHPGNPSRPPLKKPGENNATDHITFIGEDISGKIWIGTFSGGINVYDPATRTTAWYGNGAGSKEKIEQSEFWSFCKTRDGILWIAPFYASEFYKINLYQNKLPYHYTGKAVASFMDDTGKAFWMTTNKGLVHQDGSLQQTYYIDKKTAPKPHILLDIIKDNANKIWISSFDGLYVFDPVKKIFAGYHHQTGNKNSLISDTVFVLKKSEVGELWVGTTAGLDRLDLQTGTFKHFLNDPKDTTSISSNMINSIAADSDKNMWFGTNAGLNRYNEKTGRFKRYLKSRGCFVLNDSRGNLFAGSETGLFKYDKKADNFSIFAMEGSPVYSITEDHEMNLWILTNSGIVKLNSRNGETNIYGKRQGVNLNAMSFLGYTRHDGELLWGDSSGYFAFHPDKLLHRSPAPNIVINQFLLADLPLQPAAGGILTQPVFRTKEIRLKHNQATFGFGFTNIDYTSEYGDDQVFYMLENYDSKWRNAGSDQAASYYNIPPGRYTFKLKSINLDGLHTEKQFGIVISPPWWQTWWAYILFALAFAGSLWAFIYYRSLSLLKEKRTLEHKVLIRTEEVMQQKEEIQAQRDHLEKAFGDLKSTQTQLIQSEKMASLGELTAGIAHEIQNPLNFVNNFSELSAELAAELKAELKNGNTGEAIAIAGDLEKNLEKIQHHGKRADGIVKGMLQHSKTGSGVKEPFNINALACEYMRLAYHGLRAKDKSFNAEMVSNLDPDLPPVNIVPQDMGRVMLNLFNNAFYAVNQKRKTAGENYQPKVTVTTASENGHAVIKVKDNGSGIPDSIKDKIMQPFFTTKPTGEGTGLGLSLSYEIVVAGHGGTIHINSREGEGAEFVIKLSVN
jgi:signal transduction histidine kinase/ligand-binding sensor domain-containing protein